MAQTIMHTGEQHSEEQLLERVANSDEAAFRCLYDLHRDKLFAYIYRITGSTAMANETVKEVFLIVWNERFKLILVSSFDAYIFTIVRDHAIYLARHAPFRKDLQDTLATASPEASEVTVHLMQYKALHTELHNALGRLPAQQRIIFTMHRIEGISVKEIAFRLDLSRDTVIKNIEQASEALKAASDMPLK